MLNKEELDEYKELVEQANEAKSTMQDIQTEINLHKSQCVPIFKEYNCKGFSEISKIEDELTSLEADIRAKKEEMTEYIMYAAKKKEEKERIMLG